MTTAEKGLYTYKMYTQCTHTHIDNVGKKLIASQKLYTLLNPNCTKMIIDEMYNLSYL